MKQFLFSLLVVSSAFAQPRVPGPVIITAPAGGSNASVNTSTVIAIGDTNYQKLLNGVATNETAFGTASNTAAITINSNSWLEIQTSKTNGNEGEVFSQDYTNFYFGIGLSGDTPVGAGRWIGMPDRGGLHWVGGGSFWYHSQLHGANHGVTSMNGGPDCYIAEGFFATQPGIQIGGSFPGHAVTYLQYDDDPTTTAPFGHSHILQFRSRIYSAGDYAYPGILSYMTTTNSAGQGVLAFCSRTPEWTQPLLGHYQTPDIAGTVILLMDTNHIWSPSNYVIWNGNGGGMSNVTAQTLVNPATVGTINATAVNATTVFTTLTNKLLRTDADGKIVTVATYIPNSPAAGDEMKYSNSTTITNGPPAAVSGGSGVSLPVVVNTVLATNKTTGNYMQIWTNYANNAVGISFIRFAGGQSDIYQDAATAQFHITGNPVVFDSTAQFVGLADGIVKASSSGQLSPATVNFDYLSASSPSWTGIASGNGSLLTNIPNSALSGIIRKYKASAQTVNNASTPVDDSDLSFPIAANEAWSVTIYLYYTTVTSVPRFKFQFTGPASPTSVLYWGTDEGGFTGATGVKTAFSTAATFNSLGALTTDAIIVKLIVVNGVNSGTITFQWAQNAATAENTVLNIGSCLIATKLN